MFNTGKTKNKRIESTLIIDLSPIAHATYHAGVKIEMAEVEHEAKMNYWRKLMLTSLHYYKNKFKPDEFIIAVDSKSWRKKIFKYYKAKRDMLKDNSDVDYIAFIETLKDFSKELKENFPYVVLSIDGCEADDIIAIMCTELSPKRKIINIVSGDHDFRQLLSMKNVKLFSNKTKEFVDVDDPKAYRMYHILHGDSGDGVPNVLSDDDVFINEDKRQKPCGDKKISEIMMTGIKEWAEDNKEKHPDFKRNFIRNKKLVILNKINIPEKLWKKCKEDYKNYEHTPASYDTVLNYLTSVKQRVLIEKIEGYLS